MIKVTYELNGDFLNDRKPQRKTFKTEEDAIVDLQDGWLLIVNEDGRVLFGTHSHKVLEVKGQYAAEG